MKTGHGLSNKLPEDTSQKYGQDSWLLKKFES